MNKIEAVVNRALKAHTEFSEAMDEVHTHQQAIMEDFRRMIPLAEIGRRTGVSIEHLSRVASGTSPLTISSLCRINDAVRQKS